MSFVPTVPGAVAPMQYGQGYGNWQQYAGFDKNNPFGGEAGIPAKEAVRPPTSEASPTAKAPEHVAPDYSLPVPPTPLGMKPSGSLGVPSISMESAINSHYNIGS